jgi:hypothetical protein
MISSDFSARPDFAPTLVQVLAFFVLSVQTLIRSHGSESPVTIP